MRNGVEAGSHFRYHWSPSLALLWPFVAVTRSALPLQLVQAAATACCAPLVAALARPYTGRRIAEALGVVTLLYPPLLALGFDEFHELGLFTPLVLALVLCADRRSWTAFALCAAAAIGLREDAALTLVVFGLVLAGNRKTRPAAGSRAARRFLRCTARARRCRRRPRGRSARGARTLLRRDHAAIRRLGSEPFLRVSVCERPARAPRGAVHAAG